MLREHFPGNISANLHQRMALITGLCSVTLLQPVLPCRERVTNHSTGEEQFTTGPCGVKREKKSKFTSAIFVADVGKPPDVAQVHGKTDDGEKEVDLLAPALSLWFLLLLLHQVGRRSVHQKLIRGPGGHLRRVTGSSAEGV